MSRKTHVSADNLDVEGRFANWVKMTCDLISPKNLMLVAGRATAKTSDIIAERSQEIVHDMPGSYQVFTADTYVNALKNVVPTLLEGWQRKGWVKGKHYVTDERPPAHFKLPYKPVHLYKHTISVFNGCFFNLVSMDQPTSAAGNSYQHIYGDEVRYQDPDKLKKLTPALRGEYVNFGHSVYYRGRTFATDMPNVTEGDYDWILDAEEQMDVEQIKLALQCAFVLNKIKKELYNAIRDNDRRKTGLLRKNLERWIARWMRARKGSTFFLVVSSYVNADVLTSGYFEDALQALGIEEFKSSVLSFKATVNKGEKFYVNLGEHHFYDDGTKPGFYDDIAIGEDFEPTSLGLKYVQHDKPLDAGVDFGNMCSMVTGQERGNYYYCLKNFYTLAPEHTRELANRFLTFYQHHKDKRLNLYYDRSGNQNQKVQKDLAGELESFLVRDTKGRSTGWSVNLVSRNQSTIYHAEEYAFMKNMMGGYFKGIPQLKIDRYQCKELKSSMELAKTKMHKNRRTGASEILKDKSSEKLSLKRLPMHSTNMSDALKYLLYRKAWVKLQGGRKSSGMMTPGLMG